MFEGKIATLDAARLFFFSFLNLIGQNFLKAKVSHHKQWYPYKFREFGPIWKHFVATLVLEAVFMPKLHSLQVSFQNSKK